MKKISFAVLAVFTLLMVSCGQTTPPDVDTFEYVLEEKQGDSYVKVKNGDTFTVSTTDELGYYKFKGKLTTTQDFILVIDVNRPAAGLNDQLCFAGNCRDGNMQTTERFEDTVLKVEPFEGYSDFEAKLKTDVVGEYPITYSLYPKDNASNKLTFTVIFKKES